MRGAYILFTNVTIIVVFMCKTVGSHFSWDHELNYYYTLRSYVQALSGKKRGIFT